MTSAHKNAVKIRWLTQVFSVVLCNIIFSCCAVEAVNPAAGYTPLIGEKAAETAVAMIGMPYKYRGESPKGFDCSGLVRYCFLAAGLDAPHGTKALKSVTRPVSFEDIWEGDLLFFNERGRGSSHVGIFLSGDLFVHAPSSGGQVRTDSLNDPHWEKSFVEARRFL